MSMLATMQPIRLPEGGRAALAFRFDGDLAATQRAAMHGASRGNLLKEWLHLPQWVRQDHSFQSLMDHYRPVFDQPERPAAGQIRDNLKELFGGQIGARLARAFTDPDAPATDEEVIAAIKSVPVHRACLDLGCPFGIIGVAVSTSNTTKTVVGVKTPANQAVRIWGIDMGFDGTTSTNGPAIIECDTNTFGANPPGTNSTSVTPIPLDSGRPETFQSTYGKAWSTEPTALSLIEAFFIPNYMGSGIIFTPLTKPFVAKGGSGFSIRVQQQSGITGNATGALKVEE